MVATTSRPRQEPNRRTNESQRGAAGEKLELLRLRESDNPVARAIALFGCQVLRKLEEIEARQEVES